MTLPLETILAKLPIAELKQTVAAHVVSLVQLLPDKRLGAVVECIMLGILGHQTPVITQIAGANSKEQGETCPMAKRIDRFLHNPRVKTESLYEGMYAIGQQVVEQESPAYLVVAVDPVNFEKPYAKAVEGVSTVHKATPPGLDGKARLAHGYPAITATVVNTQVPVTSYANWFSYRTADFIKFYNRRRRRNIIAQNQINVAHDQIARRHTINPRMTGQDFFCHCHAHLLITPCFFGCLRITAAS